MVVEIGVRAREVGGGHGRVQDDCEGAKERQFDAELVVAAHKEGDGSVGGDERCCCRHGGCISAKTMSESSDERCRW